MRFFARPLDVCGYWSHLMPKKNLESWLKHERFSRLQEWVREWVSECALCRLYVQVWWCVSWCVANKTQSNINMTNSSMKDECDISKWCLRMHRTCAPISTMERAYMHLFIFYYTFGAVWYTFRVRLLDALCARSIAVSVLLSIALYLSPSPCTCGVWEWRRRQRWWWCRAHTRVHVGVCVCSISIYSKAY